MKIKVKLFGMLADVAGKTEVIFENTGDTDALRKNAIHNYPAMKNTSFLVAINKKVVSGNQEFRVEDEIALLPPYSGG